MYYVKNNRNILFLLGDLIAVSISLYFAAFHYFDLQQLLNSVPLILGFLILTVLMVNSYEGIFSRGILVEAKETLYFAFKMMLVIYFVSGQVYKVFISFHSFIYLMCVMFVLVYTFRLIEKQVFQTLRNAKKNVIIISDLENIENIRMQLNAEEKVIGIISKDSCDNYRDIPVVHHLEQITSFLLTNSIDEVYVNGGEFDMHEVVSWTNKIGITTNINLTPYISNLNGHYLFNRQNQNVYLTSFLNIARLYQVVLKRLMDIVLSIIGIGFMLIALIFVYPIVKKQSPGPIFFKQKRMGKNGKVFNMYKFRSMYLDAEARKQELLKNNELESNLMFKMKEDPRIFPFGKIMRKTSIDELPQFINVLKGDMSVVGTRPPTLDEWVQYEPHHFKRLFAKPGITGLWQVSGRSDITNFEDVVKLDMEYIENWRLLLDIKIIIKTFLVIFTGKGSS